jgi:hypothetical protein
VFTSILKIPEARWAYGPAPTTVGKVRRCGRRRDIVHHIPTMGVAGGRDDRRAASCGGLKGLEGGMATAWQGRQDRRAAPARWQSQIRGQLKVQVSRFEAINRHTLRLTPHVNHEALGSCFDDTEGSVIGRS